MTPVKHNTKIYQLNKGGSVLLARGCHTAGARAQVPLHRQLHRHQLVPRVAAGGAALRLQEIHR